MSICHKIQNTESGWGALFLPEGEKLSNAGGLRTVIFGSTHAGTLVIDSLQRFERKYPQSLNLRGVATDDPCDPDTKISVRKRIWRYYRPDEMMHMRDEMISAATGAGIPCYTGNVKTAYFREILRQWDPELIIMCCFGQKVDPFIFEYPAHGMYNFHPSELASQIGIGSQPFLETLSNGKTTSVMTVHLVNEWIDRGPIVGWSPRVRITRADGSYPASILSLQEKIPSVCGWLSVELILQILKQKENGTKGAGGIINFDEQIPETIRQKLLEPVVDDPSERYTLPLHEAIRES